MKRFALFAVVLLCTCAWHAAFAAEPAPESPVPPGFVPPADALEFTITAYQHGEPHSGYVFDTTQERLSSFCTGSQDGQFECFMLMQYSELPGAPPEWLGRELARFSGNLQQVRFHGATFTFYSAAPDWIEIEVRGCPFADLQPYLAVTDLSEGLDEGIKNKLYRPLGRVAFAANLSAPVPWPAAAPEDAPEE